MTKRLSSIVTGLVLVLAVTAVRAVTVHEATGKGAILDNDGNSVSLQFKAGIDDLGNIFGEVQQTTHLPGKDFKFHGTVLCFDLLSDNTAVFGGVIDSSSDPSLVGQFFVVEVVDDTPDQYGFDITTRQPDCTRVNVKLDDLIRGSIHVH